jgi:FlaG/FlaF family flagellin (archaellin)
MIKNKKAVSAVVGVVIMVALVIGLTAIVWTILTGLVEDELDNAKTCVGTSGKVFINDVYTCYNSSELRIGVGVKDIDVDGAIVSIYGDNEIKSMIIDGKHGYTGVRDLNGGTDGENLIFPNKSAGKTYFVDLTSGDFQMQDIDRLEIAPLVGDSPCDISNTLLNVDNCQVFNI